MAERTPLVFVLVLNYNSKRYLLECLKSLSSLTYPSFQIVVLDSASTDDSFTEAKQRFPQCQYLPLKENKGFATGMNEGIRYALAHGADFVWLFNPDATCAPGTLTVLVEAFLADPKRKFMSPIITDAEGQIWFAGGTIDYLRMRAVHTRMMRSVSEPYRTGYLTGCSPLIHREVLETVGLLDERFFLYYEDAEYSKRVKKTGYEPFVVPGAHVVHAEQSTTDNPRKTYFLVYYGLLFFALHTPGYLRPYTAGYLALRRLYNWFQVRTNDAQAVAVRQAYRDYFSHYQNGFQLYLRKLQ